MAHKRSILRVLIVGLALSTTLGALLLPAAGLSSSQTQGASHGPRGTWGTTYASTLANAEIQTSVMARSDGVQCPEGTIAYWKLDEIGGALYEDAYDGHDGQCAGACPSPAGGQVNGGQAFDASSTGIDVPAHMAFDWGQSDSFSIEFWMARSGTMEQNEVIVGRDDTPTSGLHWWVGLWEHWPDTGAAMFYLIDTSGKTYSVQGTTLLLDGAWHHIAAVRNGSGKRLRIYVDGLLEGETTNASYNASFASPTAAVNIGWLDRTGSSHGFRFGGILDDVAIHNRALGDAEVAQHYARGLAGRGVCSNPAMAVEKTVDPAIIYPGQTVVYSYALTNSGDVALLNLDVDDDKCTAMSGPQGGDGDDELDPSEVWTYTCSMALSADTTNIVTASGTYTYPLSGTTSTTDTRSVDVIAPAIVVDKTADPAIVYPGTTVTYTYAVTNQGDDALSNVDIGDDVCDPVTVVVGDDTLDPDETQTYTCSMAVSEDITNTATFTGTDLLGTMWTFTGQAFVDVVAPEVTVDKTADPEIILSGDTVNYTYVVHNGGDDRLFDTDLEDDQCAPVNAVGGDDRILDPGETQTYTCVTPVYVDTTNTATFTGLDLLGTTWTFTGTAFVDVRGPQIALAKTASATAVHPGEVVVYTYKVTNPGDDPLSDVRVEDNKCSSMVGPQGDVNRNRILDLDETWTYTCSMALYQTTTNTAIAYGTPSAGPDKQSTPAQVTVQVSDYLLYLPLVVD